MNKIIHKIKCYLNIHAYKLHCKEVIYGIVHLNDVKTTYKRNDHYWICEYCGKEIKI